MEDQIQPLTPPLPADPPDLGDPQRVHPEDEAFVPDAEPGVLSGPPVQTAAAR